MEFRVWAADSQPCRDLQALTVADNAALVRWDVHEVRRQVVFWCLAAGWQE